jgi:hypothetical protein
MLNNKIIVNQHAKTEDTIDPIMNRVLSKSLLKNGSICIFSDFANRNLNNDPIMKHKPAIIPPDALLFSVLLIFGSINSKVLAQVKVTLDRPIKTAKPRLEIAVLSKVGSNMTNVTKRTIANIAITTTAINIITRNGRNRFTKNFLMN